MESLLTAREVRKMLKVSLPLVYKMAERGQLPCIRWDCPGEGTEKPRTMVRFEADVVYQFIKNHRQECHNLSQEGSESQ